MASSPLGQDEELWMQECGAKLLDECDTADEISIADREIINKGMKLLGLHAADEKETEEQQSISSISERGKQTQKSDKIGEHADEVENDTDTLVDQKRYPSYYHLEEMNKVPVPRIVRLAAVPSQYQLDCLSEVFFCDAPVLSPNLPCFSIADKEISSTETCLDTNVPLALPLELQHSRRNQQYYHAPNYYAESVCSVNSEYVMQMFH